MRTEYLVVLVLLLFGFVVGAMLAAAQARYPAFPMFRRGELQIESESGRCYRFVIADWPTKPTNTVFVRPCD